jgi:hypothetical protein
MGFDNYIYSLANNLKNDAQQQIVRELVLWSHEEADRFGLPPGGEDDQRDAFRHALISAELAHIFQSTTLSKLLMDQYERSTGGTPESHNMDFWNNNVGRKIANEVPESDYLNPNLSERVYNALIFGRLITDPYTDTRKWSEPTTVISNGTNIQEGGCFISAARATAVEGSAGAHLKVQSPLVLDLDGDGLDFTDLAPGTASFDLDGDGFATKTAWVGPDDGLLVLDRNGDGMINDISELFGNEQAQGFQILGELDTDSDGCLWEC